MDNIPYGYCHCGCGQKTKLAPQTDSRRGWVQGQPQKRINGHGGFKTNPQYKVDNPTGCWVWQRGVSGRGYGYIQRNGIKLGAHRHYYQEHYGEIPEGYDIHHTCSNTLCVNPQHLQALSKKEHSRLSPSVKLTPDQVQEIRRLLDEGHTLKSLADRFGVVFQTISQIKRGVNWS